MIIITSYYDMNQKIKTKQFFFQKFHLIPILRNCSHFTLKGFSGETQINAKTPKQQQRNEKYESPVSNH